jgi:hypothetical protein
MVPGFGRKGAGIMQGIGRVGGPGAAGPAGKVRVGKGGFSLGGAGAAGSAAEAHGTAAVAAPGLGLLALQSGQNDQDRDREARRRADALLEDLAGLQVEMLGGAADPARLARLAALAHGDAGADPALRELVEAIALRAAIELARRGG